MSISNSAHVSRKLDACNFHFRLVYTLKFVAFEQF